MKSSIKQANLLHPHHEKLNSNKEDENGLQTGKEHPPRDSYILLSQLKCNLQDLKFLRVACIQRKLARLCQYLSIGIEELQIQSFQRTSQRQQMVECNWESVKQCCRGCWKSIKDACCCCWGWIADCPSKVCRACRQCCDWIKEKCSDCPNYFKRKCTKCCSCCPTWIKCEECCQKDNRQSQDFEQTSQNFKKQPSSTSWLDMLINGLISNTIRIESIKDLDLLTFVSDLAENKHPRAKDLIKLANNELSRREKSAPTPAQIAQIWWQAFAIFYGTIILLLTAGTYTLTQIVLSELPLKECYYAALGFGGLVIVYLNCCVIRPRRSIQFFSQKTSYIELENIVMRQELIENIVMRQELIENIEGIKQ